MPLLPPSDPGYPYPYGVGHDPADGYPGCPYGACAPGCPYGDDPAAACPYGDPPGCCP
ncbi:hypothetical protein [Kribbella sp. NPDC050470]|uniref:hypothetical protein n=1 Tax=unclassified Kribbella TaxID=2644121 RepID=UPI0037AAB1CC